MKYERFLTRWGGDKDTPRYNQFKHDLQSVGRDIARRQRELSAKKADIKSVQHKDSTIFAVDKNTILYNHIKIFENE